MKGVVKGAAGALVAAALVCALTGCEDSGSPAAAKGAGATGSPAPAGDGSGPGSANEAAPVWLDATGMYYALPTDESVGETLVGGDPVVVQDGDAGKYCAQEAGAPCTGVQSAGHKEMEVRGSGDERSVEFTLFTFPTADGAGRVMHALADRLRTKDAQDGTPAKPLSIAPGADETDAFQRGDVSEAVLRIGAVVAHVHAYDVQRGDLEHAAKVQVSRVLDISAGKKPDA